MCLQLPWRAGVKERPVQPFRTRTPACRRTVTVHLPHQYVHDDKELVNNESSLFLLWRPFAMFPVAISVPFIPTFYHSMVNTDNCLSSCIIAEACLLMNPLFSSTSDLKAQTTNGNLFPLGNLFPSFEKLRTGYSDCIRGDQHRCDRPLCSGVDSLV